MTALRFQTGGEITHPRPPFGKKGGGGREIDYPPACVFLAIFTGLLHVSTDVADLCVSVEVLLHVSAHVISANPKTAAVS